MTDSRQLDVTKRRAPISDSVTLEVCVGDIAGLDAAIAGGADRLELCGTLSIGGLGPSAGLIAAAAAAAVPVHMLVRPRDGGFRYTAREVAMMAADIDAAVQAGLAGVVIGASDADGALDAALLARLIDHARRTRMLSVTLHRVFDLCPDPAAALETAIALGCDRVLTSGGASRACDGVALLGVLHRQAAGRIRIMAGSGISAATVAPILAAGIGEIHASCSRAEPMTETAEYRLGFAAAIRRCTDATLVRELRSAINPDRTGQYA